MNEFYIVKLDKREKRIQAIGYVVITLICAVAITIASGIFA